MKYLQIAQSGQGYPNLVKKSKFIGSAAQISSEQEAQEFIDKIRNQQHRASHNCWAYRIYTPKGIIPNESDDGEPRGTAGQPILYVMEQQNIINTIVVITRYYGGIKLGKGGLSRAYTKTTAELLRAIGIRQYL